MPCSSAHPNQPTTSSLQSFWSKPVSAPVQVSPPSFTPPEKERHKIYCYLLLALLADYWTPKRAYKASLPAASPMYLGHNIAALAVNSRGEVLGFDFNHNEIFNSSVEHAEARLMRRLLSRPDYLFPTGHYSFSRSNATGVYAGIADAAKDFFESVVARVEAEKSHYPNALKDITIYTSLESCAQCSGMMALGAVKRVVYIQPDAGQNAIGNILFNLNMGSSYAAPKPIPACAFDLQQFDALETAYQAYASSAPPKAKSAQLAAITAFLCSDEARDIFTRTRDAFRRTKLRHPGFTPTDNDLTNAQVLDHVKTFWLVARTHGRRGTPHPR
jgi:tRNA(Arg) A34 adenosine deaminase TadA